MPLFWDYREKLFNSAFVDNF